MKFIFHGGAREVGKSCIELQSGGNRFILDAGLKFKEHGFEAPFQVFDIPYIDGLFLSHAHLDHTGALPLFEHNNMLCPIFTTQQTKELTAILLKDSYKIARIRHLHPAYQKPDLKKVSAATRIVDFDKDYKHMNLEFKFLNAGHIPGSAMILIKVEGKKILYTGDYKLNTSHLMKGASSSFGQYAQDFKDIDVMITESTYGGKQLIERSAVETSFLDRVSETLKKGSVLIPVFALGRAQEILLLLSKRKWNVPIYYDGMCISMTRKIIDGNPSYLNEKKELIDSFRKTTLVKDQKARFRMMNNKGIFITTSGMLQGGPVMSYISAMWGNPNNSILMTGYQCKRTNGRMLLEEGFLYIDGWKTYVKAAAQNFQFSGHADDTELKQFITMVSPKNLIINHGDEESCLHTKEWALKNTKCRVFVPGVGDMLDF